MPESKKERTEKRCYDDTYRQSNDTPIIQLLLSDLEEEHPTVIDK